MSQASPTNKHQAWLDAWYGKRRWSFWLLPLMWLFCAIAWLRRIWLIKFTQKSLATPVVVVGNISLGGTGKTPLLIALVKFLQAQGFAPGVISRGYGGQAPGYPYLLSASSRAAEAGDEPLSIFCQTGCQVCVGPNRLASARLLEDQGCDILLSDDGLQQYALGRDIEIAVVDGQRALGNGYCLPVGPLREAGKRLKSVDWVVVNSANAEFTLPGLGELFYVPMAIAARELVNLKTNERISPESFAGQQLEAVAGIGNPQRFYLSLQALGITPVPHDFPDHYAYRAEDFSFAADALLVMTEKDAVKCLSFARDNWYYLAIEAQLPDHFYQALLAKIKKIQQQKHQAYFSVK